VRSVTAIGPVKSDSFRDHHATAAYSMAGAKQLGGSGIMAQVESHAAGLGVTCRQRKTKTQNATQAQSRVGVHTQYKLPIAGQW
jgi:hypothetical protein